VRAANARSRLAVSSESGGAILARLAIIRRAPLRDSVFVAALRLKSRELRVSPETKSQRRTNVGNPQNQQVKRRGIRWQPLQRERAVVRDACGPEIMQPAHAASQPTLQLLASIKFEIQDLWGGGERSWWVCRICT